jgi:hypothetical protein
VNAVGTAGATLSCGTTGFGGAGADVEGVVGWCTASTVGAGAATSWCDGFGVSQTYPLSPNPAAAPAHAAVASHRRRVRRRFRIGASSMGGPG